MTIIVRNNLANLYYLTGYNFPGRLRISILFCSLSAVWKAFRTNCTVVLHANSAAFLFKWLIPGTEKSGRARANELTLIYLSSSCTKIGDLPAMNKNGRDIWPCQAARAMKARNLLRTVICTPVFYFFLEDKTAIKKKSFVSSTLWLNERSFCSLKQSGEHVITPQNKRQRHEYVYFVDCTLCTLDQCTDDSVGCSVTLYKMEWYARNRDVLKIFQSLSMFKRWVRSWISQSGRTQGLAFHRHTARVARWPRFRIHIRLNYS